MRPIYRLAGGVPWTPSTPGNLLAWFDAGSGVTQSGGLVSQWSDRAGHGYNWTQPTGAIQPGFGATAWNGTKPGITFSGGQWMQNLTGGFADYLTGTARPLSIFVTAKTTSGGNARFILQWTNAVPDQYFGFYLHATTGFIVPDVTAGSDTTVGSHAAWGSHRFGAMMQATVTSYVDASLDLNEQPFTATSGPFDRVYLGQNAVGGNLYVGTISEIVIYSAKLTGRDFANYRRYSQFKWGG